MGSLIRWSTANELERRKSQINQIGQRTVLAMREGAHLQQAVANVAVTTLVRAQQEIEDARRAGRMTPYKEHVLAHYREAYLQELLDRVRTAQHRVYRLLMKR